MAAIRYTTKEVVVAPPDDDLAVGRAAHDAVALLARAAPRYGRVRVAVTIVRTDTAAYVRGELQHEAPLWRRLLNAATGHF